VKISENRRIAWVVLAVCVVVSIVVFGGCGLKNECSGAKAAFYSGGGDAYFSLDSYINRRAEYAGKMSALAQANKLDAGLVQALDAAVSDVRAAGDINAKLLANRNMADAADKLYALIAADSSMSDTDKRDAKLLYADLTDAAGKMAGDQYFIEAERYNAVLGGFPASILSRLFGLERLEVVL